MQSSSNVKTGYIPLKSFVEQMDTFETRTQWKLPLHFMDKLQFLFLKLIVRFSWFADRIYIENPAQYGIGYDQLFNYVNRHLFTIGIRRQGPTLQTIHYYHWRFFHKQTNGVIEPFALGTDFDHDVALSKSFGEGLERYFTLLSKVHTIPTSTHKSFKEMSGSKTPVFFPPKEHAYTTVQKETNQFLYQDTNQSIEWVAGEYLGTGKTGYIPKQLLSRQCQKLLMPKEGMLAQVTTNGGAGWFTKDGATYKALFELIQRDAFMVPWLTKQTLPALDISTITDEAILSILSHLHAAKAEVLILKAAAVGDVPTAIVIVFDHGLKEEQVYVTAHTDTTFTKAVMGALQEVMVFFAEKPTFVLPAGYKPFVTTGITRNERINLYKGRVLSDSVRALHSGTFVPYAEAFAGSFASGTDSEILQELIARLTALGEAYVPFIYEYQHPLLKKVGFHVVKSFIPALFPLYLSEHMAPIQSKRLGTYEQNHQEILTVLNNTPHPFP